MSNTRFARTFLETLEKKYFSLCKVWSCFASDEIVIIKCSWHMIKQLDFSSTRRQ